MDRLDPRLLAEVSFDRVRLSLGTLPVVRRSLDERRAQLVAECDSGSVSVESSAVELPDRSIGLRVYRGTSERPAPVLVYLHSGALVLGNLDTDHERCLVLAREAHCVVVSVDYRLAPEHPYPAAFDDCAAVVEALADDPGSWGVDPERLAVGGNSAGAGLAAAVALRTRDRAGPRLCFQLLHQPMLDSTCRSSSMAEFVATPGFDSGSARFSWGAYLGGRPATAYASPSSARSLADLPRAYVSCAEVDPLRDEGMDYARRLIAGGVPTELHVVPGACHGFDTLAPRYPPSFRAVEQQSDALAQAFAWSRSDSSAHAGP
jgi:acetyl esterase/lipase